MNALRDSFRKALSNCRTTYNLLSSSGLHASSSKDDEEEVKGAETSLNDVFFTYNYLTQSLNLKQELVTDLGLSEVKVINDDRRFRISVEANHSEYTRVHRKFKDLVASILSRTV